jgi:hypothetical protein
VSITGRSVTQRVALSAWQEDGVTKREWRFEGMPGYEPVTAAYVVQHDAGEWFFRAFAPLSKNDVIFFGGGRSTSRFSTKALAMAAADAWLEANVLAPEEKT